MINKNSRGPHHDPWPSLKRAMHSPLHSRSSLLPLRDSTSSSSKRNTCLSEMRATPFCGLGGISKYDLSIFPAPSISPKCLGIKHSNLKLTVYLGDWVTFQFTKLLSLELPAKNETRFYISWIPVSIYSPQNLTSKYMKNGIR